MFHIKPKFSNDKKKLNLNVGHLLTNLAEIIFAHKRTLSFSNNFKNTRGTCTTGDNPSYVWTK